MKWRERISILSRKRKHIRNLPGEENQNDQSSLAGSSDGSERENVNKTLSQIRPVIGPDHKSYYILLRGNEDSFTCIQPAKDVITSLDEVVRNVVNSVKETRTHGITLPPYLRTSRNGEARPHRTTTKKHIGEITKINGLSSLKNEKRMVSSLNVESLYDFKPEQKFLGTENVVENVVLNRTVQTINSNHNEVTRTSTLVYPLVQNRLDSSSIVSVADRHQSCVYSSSKKTLEKSITHDLGISPTRENVYTQSHSVISNAKQDSAVQINSDISSDLLETPVPEVNEFIDKTNSVTEIRLIAKDGCVLTEESIAEQVKALIESETLIIGEDSHIVATRDNAHEVILRITPKLTDVKQILQEHQEKEENLDIRSDILQEEYDDIYHEEESTLTLPDTSLQDEICYDPDIVVNSNNNGDAENRVEYLLTSISPTPDEIFEDCDVLKNSDLENVIHEEVEDSSGYCMIDPSIQDSEQLEVEKFLLNGHSLFSPNEEIIVFQRADGTLVNQDGTPVSSELQYLIAMSQSEEQAILPDGYANQIFLSTKH